MATFTVTNTNDSGAGSLRQAVLDANASYGADTIKFAVADDSVIVLTSGELAVTGQLTIDGDMDGDNKADVTVSGNDASRIISGGGGIGIGSFANLSLYSLTLEHGHSNGNGGAVYMASGSLHLTDTTVRDSSASGNGGAIMAKLGQVTLTTSLITGNTAHGGGGGLYSQGGATLTNSTVHGNVADAEGGGIKAGGTLTLLNSTVTGNQADADGAAPILPGQGTDGGGIALIGSFTNATITNSVVAENTANTGGITQDDVLGTVATSKASAFGSFVTITSNTNSQFSVTNTGLGALKDNGGTTLTRNIESLSSSLINTGDTYAAHLLPKDADGNSRVAFNFVDIGATEFQGATLKVTTAADVIDANDGKLSLREAINFLHLSNDHRITFDKSLAGQTITLSSELALTQDVIIDGDVNGDDKADITISGGDITRIFNISGSATDVDLLSLMLEHGRAGAIYVASSHSLDILNSTVRNNVGTRGGGLFMKSGNLTMVNTLVAANYASSQGGGIFLDVNADLRMTNSTIYGNTAGGEGGGVANRGFAHFYFSTITANRTLGIYSAPFAYGGGVTSLIDGMESFMMTVVAGNTSGAQSSHPDVSGYVEDATRSVFGTSVDHGLANFQSSYTNVANVGLGQLLDNGGTVLTCSPLDGSFLIGKGGTTLPFADTFDLDHDGNTTELLPFDARGRLRLVGGALDIGAVEQVVSERIKGTEAANHIYGGLGNDLIEGLGGADVLDGGAGKDTISYANSKTGVKVSLVTGLGTGGDAAGDTVSGFENITGSAKGDTLTGDGAANQINAGSGNDRITGGGGVDKLSGAAGSDTFVTSRSSVDRDIIKAFISGEDHLEISAALFKGGLAAGTPLAADQLAITTDGLATDANDRFILDTSSGELYFDSNGSADGGHILIAVFKGGIPALTAGDFIIV